MTSLRDILLACVCGLLTLGLAGCNFVNEDLSVCGAEFTVDYNLRVVTNMSTELRDVLNEPEDAAAAEALRSHLGPIFTDRAHDIDLSFYSTEADSARLHHETHIMDASQQSYTLYLDARNYMHDALANLTENTAVQLYGDDRCHTAHLASRYSSPDTLPSHSTGLFSARLPMNVSASANQHFDVPLYMINCATALVLDTTACNVRDIRILTSGFATGFHVTDSLYDYRPNSVVQADRVATAGGPKACFCAVGFPSQEAAASRTVIETDEPFATVDSDETLWAYHCYVTLAGGTTTETILSLKRPLRAGQLKVVKAKLDSEGVVRTFDMTIGVSVTLDWHKGNEYNPLF